MTVEDLKTTLGMVTQPHTRNVFVQVDNGFRRDVVGVEVTPSGNVTLRIWETKT